MWPLATACWDASSIRSAGPLDNNGPLTASKRLPIERPAAAIMDRAPVIVPVQTGLIVVDALVPIGRGQRELILATTGRTGKTAIAIDTIVNQRGQNVSVRLLRHRGSARLPWPGPSPTSATKARWSTPSWL